MNMVLEEHVAIMNEIASSSPGDELEALTSAIDGDKMLSMEDLSGWLDLERRQRLGSLLKGLPPEQRGEILLEAAERRRFMLRSRRNKQVEKRSAYLRILEALNNAFMFLAENKPDIAEKLIESLIADIERKDWLNEAFPPSTLEQILGALKLALYLRSEAHDGCEVMSLCLAHTNKDVLKHALSEDWSRAGAV